MFLVEVGVQWFSVVILMFAARICLLCSVVENRNALQAVWSNMDHMNEQEVPHHWQASSLNLGSLGPLVSNPRLVTAMQIHKLESWTVHSYWLPLSTWVLCSSQVFSKMIRCIRIASCHGCPQKFLGSDICPQEFPSATRRTENYLTSLNFRLGECKVEAFCLENIPSGDICLPGSSLSSHVEKHPSFRSRWDNSERHPLQFAVHTPVP